MPYISPRTALAEGLRNLYSVLTNRNPTTAKPKTPAAALIIRPAPESSFCANAPKYSIGNKTGLDTRRNSGSVERYSVSSG
jgi:hypothetical protein